MDRCAFPTRKRLMVPVGDPLEPRFKLTVGTAQAGDPSHTALRKGRRFFCPGR
jgi:hypothetical protein